MILANVAAAEELEAKHRSFPYRVHDAPDPDKVAELRDFLASLSVPGVALAKGEVLRPELFNRLLRRVGGLPQAALVNELVLRAQAQAAYSPGNLGHFGLALRRYCHFTSPIRRYADLLVHRALIEEVLANRDLAETAEHISATERRAAAAERAAFDRYAALLLAGEIGTVFAAHITGVADFGLFVAVSNTGANGLVPVSTLPADYYRRDESGHRLIGRHTRRSYTLGDSVAVRLVEADAVSGRLVFRLEETETTPGLTAPRRGGYPLRRRPGRSRADRSADR